MNNGNEVAKKASTNNPEPLIDYKKHRYAVILILAVLFFSCTIGFVYLFGVHDLIDLSDYITVSGDETLSERAKTYEITFPEVENIEQYDLKFSSKGCVVEVVSGDKVIYSYGAAQSVDKRYIGRVYSTVPLSEVDLNSPLEIHLNTSDYGSDAILNKSELCPRSETLRYYLTNGSASFPLALFSFSMVFLIMMFTVIGKKKTMIGAGICMSGALMCFSVILLDGCGHYLVFTSNMDIWNIVFWLSAYLFPFFVIMFFREAETSVNYKKSLLAIALVNFAFFIGAVIVVIINIVPLYYLTKEYHFLLMADGLIGIIHIIKNRKNKSIMDLRALLITTVIWVILELVNYFCPNILTVYMALPILDYRSISAILLFYSFCLTYSAMTYEASKKRWMQYQQINQLEQREQQLTPYQEMASAFFENYEGIYYIDIMTNSFACYYQSKDYEKLEIDKFGEDFFEASIRNTKDVVYEEDVDYVIKMISKENVLEGVKDGKRYSYVFRMMQNGQLTFFQVHGKMEQSGKHIIIGVRNINDIMQQEETLRAASNQLQKAKEELHLSRIKNFNSQMQPHFLYNVLSSIQEIIYDDPEYASRLIGNFTVHLRGTIKAISNDNPIVFSEELKNIKAYVEIEKMRLTDRLQVKYDIQAEDFMVAPLSVQPLVENAIKHGIYQKGEIGGTLCIRSFDTDTAWVIQVIDDGVGFDYNQVLEEVEEGQRDSTGLKNLKFRIEKLMNATLQIKSQPGDGTQADIIIPKEGEDH